MAKRGLGCSRPACAAAFWGRAFPDSEGEVGSSAVGQKVTEAGRDPRSSLVQPAAPSRLGHRQAAQGFVLLGLEKPRRLETSQSLRAAPQCQTEGTRKLQRPGTFLCPCVRVVSSEAAEGTVPCSHVVYESWRRGGAAPAQRNSPGLSAHTQHFILITRCPIALGTPGVVAAAASASAGGR